MPVPCVLLLVLALAACKHDDTDKQDTAAPIPEPGALQAGFAQASIPAPLGIGTAGFGPFDVPTSVTPYADIYPGTTRFHGFPQIRVTVISRGEGFELVFVRLDAVGVFQQIRRALVLELESRTGRDLDDALIIGGTHTHSGPGRIIDYGGIFDYIADKFFPEFYDRFIDALADTVEAAYADLQPARVGHVMATGPGGHNDRRCEDGGADYTNDTTPLIAIERNGVVDGLVMAYPVHGTILGIEVLNLSRDVAGGIEEAVEDGFDHPVQVMMFNAWGADMSPGDPKLPANPGADMPDGYERMERVGQVVAEGVHAALPGVVFGDTPDIAAQTYRVPIDRDILGYADGEFPYEYGAVYCEGDDDCDIATTVEGLDLTCVPFNEKYSAPTQTEFTVGHLGDLHFTTFTGEPGTRLAEYVIAGMQTHDGVNDVMFFGYSQDYLGYSILEDDWWQGGYEASGALWGPLQGQYLADETLRGFDDFMDVAAYGEEPEPVVPFEEPAYTPISPTTALSVGTVLTPVNATYVVGETVDFAVQGEDPWLGAPVATLESADGQPILRPGGLPFTSDGYRFYVDLLPDPPYTDEASSRAFVWTFHLPVGHRYDAGPALAGEYRIRVALPRADGSSTEVTSDVFSVVSK